jgi:hypothetical protein
MATGFVPWRALQMLNGWFETLLEIQGEGHPSPNPVASPRPLYWPAPAAAERVYLSIFEPSGQLSWTLSAISYIITLPTKVTT